MEEIVNKVQQSGLIAVDLADYLPAASAFEGFDFAPRLWNGLVLKEKDFRDFLKEHDWSQYAGKHVYLFCSEEAILPSWAFMIVSSKLVGVAASVTVGDLQDARQAAMEQTIRSLDMQQFADGNMEYPVNPAVQPHPELVKLGSFKAAEVNAASFAAHTPQASRNGLCP